MWKKKGFVEVRRYLVIVNQYMGYFMETFGHLVRIYTNVNF